jgi:hypothetical protein
MAMTAIRQITPERKALWLGLFAAVLFAAPAQAQYMYLDSNGDGIHTVDDRMNKSLPTTIDVWVVTDSNRDGTPGVCDFGPGAMDISSYEFVLQSVGGTVTWGPMSNFIAPFAINLARDSRDTTGTVFYHNGWGSSNSQPTGLYKLASLTATVATGSPRIDIVTRHNINRTGRTTFGSGCTANPEYDHMNRFGVNWLDADGLAAPLDAPPRVTAPELVLPQDGTQVQFDVLANDPDGDALLTLTASFAGLPAGHNATFASNAAHTAATFTWTPTANDSGNYNVTFTATNFLAGSRTTSVHVIGTPTDVEGAGVPAVYHLAQNRPNPFNPRTDIEYSLAKDAAVRLAIYDFGGRLVRVLVRESQSAGRHETRWDGNDRYGRAVGSGVYLCRLEAGTVRLSRRMVLLR